jgi:hypothetical protein
MTEGTDRVEFPEAEVVSENDLVLMCRVGERIVSVPPLRILPGSDVWRLGDRGRLVLPRDVARELGLV